MEKNQKTAEYFRDKSDEEIINWMVKNLSTEQIRSCLGDDTTDVVTEQTDIEKIKNYCKNKPYIIHKIVGQTVYYWYFEFSKKRWLYFNDSMDKFPSKECKEGSEMKKEVSETLDNLFLAFKYQFDTVFSEKSNLSKIMKYVPVLIESSTDETISYYYLEYEIRDDKLNIKILFEENLDIDECEKEFKLIRDYWNKLDDKIIESGAPGSSDTFTVNDVSENIKKTVNDMFSESKYKDDFLNIKANYEAISKLDNTYFITGLFPIENNFGTVKNFNTLNDYVENYYGKTFTKLFEPYIKENKFGTKSIHYKIK